MIWSPGCAAGGQRGLPGHDCQSAIKSAAADLSDQLVAHDRDDPAESEKAAPPTEGSRNAEGRATLLRNLTNPLIPSNFRILGAITMVMAAGGLEAGPGGGGLYGERAGEIPALHAKRNLRVPCVRNVVQGTKKPPPVRRGLGKIGKSAGKSLTSRSALPVPRALPGRREAGGAVWLSARWCSSRNWKRRREQRGRRWQLRGTWLESKGVLRISLEK
jgi:hypothetical protein